MKVFNELVVVTVTPFSGTSTPDKNGLRSVMLQCIAGKMPNRNVLSGTIAERAGFQVGKTYLAQVREQGTDEVFGIAYTFTKVSELEGTDIINTCKEVGPPDIFLVPRPEKFYDLYERKGDAVESSTTKRIKENLFIPALNQKSNHETAKRVVDGTSVNQDSEEQIEKAIEFDNQE